MNFKELIKVPIPPAPITDIPAKASVFVKSLISTGGFTKAVKNNLYLAEIIDKMLIVTVFHGGKFKWRTFITADDYCTQKADNPKKSTAGVQKISEYGDTYIPIGGAAETVQHYVDTFHKYDTLPYIYGDWEAGIKNVEALQQRIRKNKTAEHHRKIREATEECMLEIKPPVKAFAEWIKHQSSTVYVIYNTGEDHGVCTHCLKKIARGKEKWHHRQEITCPHCRKKAKLICSGRLKSGRIERHDEYFWYVQKTSEGCCARFFKAGYFICKDTKWGEDHIPITPEWNLNIEHWELGRAFLDINGKCVKSFVWGDFMNTHELYWCKNDCTGHYGRLYTGNLRKSLSNYEQLKYMPWNKIAELAGNRFSFPHMIKKVICRPWIEYLIKVGMNRLAKDYLDRYYSEISVSDFVNGEASPVQKVSLAHILGLDRRQLREIIPYDPNSAELDLYKLLLKKRAGLNEWKLLKPYANRLAAISLALDYQPVSRYLRYIEAQAEQYIRQDRGGIVNVISDYADYIREAKAANYNMEDTATINPKNLIAAHDESETDSCIEKYKREYSKYADGLAAAAKKIAKVNGIIFEDKSYRIAPIVSWEELLNESKSLRHCVASYAKSYADGRCIIFGIRNIDTPDTPMYTLELSGDLRHIRQCRGFKNRSAPENIMEAVEKWHKNLIAKNIEKAG